jgi:NAD(P)-dependent dehydrogenase (short-subunit alcohol dehydrogenase family)
MTRRLVITGASGAIGEALARHFSVQGDAVIALSRGPSRYGTWHPCDLSDAAQIAALPDRIGTPVDALIHVAGIWEATAFTSDYSFLSRPQTETADILSVNLLAPILLTQALFPALLQSPSGRVVLIGSTSGLENIGTPEVAYNASKAGLRAAAQALQKVSPRIGVTVINPGDLATYGTLAAQASGAMADDGTIPMADMVATVAFALSLSPGSVLREMTLDPMRP